MLNEQQTVAGHYACPMHPEVQQDRPGTCPKCGMQLVVRQTIQSRAQQSEWNSARALEGES